MWLRRRLRPGNPPAPPCDAVVAFNSLHWIDPELRYSKPSELLQPGGAMVVGGCMRAQSADAERIWTDVQADYRAVGYEGRPPPSPGQIGLRHFPVEARAFFAEAASLRYPFQVVYSAADYLAILASQSGTRALGEARTADFLSRVRDRLESLRWPQLAVTFVGFLIVGRRTGTGTVASLT